MAIKHRVNVMHCISFEEGVRPKLFCPVCSEGSDHAGENRSGPKECEGCGAVFEIEKSSLTTTVRSPTLLQWMKYGFGMLFQVERKKRKGV